MILGVPGSICCGSGVACVRLVVDRGSTRGVDPDSLRGVSIRGRSGGRLGVNSGPSGIGSGPIWGRAGADLASISGRLGVVPGLGGGHCTPGVVCRAPPPPQPFWPPPRPRRAARARGEPSAAAAMAAPFDLEAAIREFAASDGGSVLQLPRLSTGQRRHARRVVAECPGLSCESAGAGPDRRLVLRRAAAEAAVLQPASDIGPQVWPKSANLGRIPHNSGQPGRCAGAPTHVHHRGHRRAPTESGSFGWEAGVGVIG